MQISFFFFPFNVSKIARDRNKRTQSCFCPAFTKGWRFIVLFLLLPWHLNHAHITERHFTPQHGDLRAQLIFNANITIWYHSNKGHCTSIGCAKPLVSFCRERMRGLAREWEWTHTHNPVTALKGQHIPARFSPFNITIKYSYIQCSQHTTMNAWLNYELIKRFVAYMFILQAQELETACECSWATIHYFVKVSS